jgi:hypothetical protein
MADNEYDHFVRRSSREKISISVFSRTFLDGGLLSKICAARDAGKLVLVLGAGVSSDSGIPDWPSLVEKLVANAVDPSHTLLKRALLSDKLSLIRKVRYLEANSASFPLQVQRCLYQDLDATKQNGTLSALTEFIVENAKRIPIQNIITYNFDDLLERSISAINPTLKVSPVFSFQSFADAHGPITVFHAHGYCPQASRASVTLLDSHLVFSESNYHLQYFDFDYWTNMVQLISRRA